MCSNPTALMTSKSRLPRLHLDPLPWGFVMKWDRVGIPKSLLGAGKTLVASRAPPKPASTTAMSTWWTHSKLSLLLQ